MFLMLTLNKYLLTGIAIKNARLTQLRQMFHFFTSWKSDKSSSFLAFSGGKEMEIWSEMN